MKAIDATVDTLATTTAVGGELAQAGVENAHARDLLPTLTASSATRGAAMRGRNAQGGPSLQQALLPTLTARDEKGPGPGHTRSGSDLPKAAGGHLSPRFCEWFMAFPLGWTEPVIGSPRSETRARRRKPKSSETSSESSSMPSDSGKDDRHE